MYVCTTFNLVDPKMLRANYLLIVLSRDYSGCMTRLFKYPPVEDVRLFIEQARNLAANKPLQTQTQQASMISQARHVTFSDFETKTPTKPQKAPEQQLTAVTLAPTFKHMLYVDMVCFKSGIASITFIL